MGGRIPATSRTHSPVTSQSAAAGSYAGSRARHVCPPSLGPAASRRTCRPSASRPAAAPCLQPAPSPPQPQPPRWPATPCSAPRPRKPQTPSGLGVRTRAVSSGVSPGRPCRPPPWLPAQLPAGTVVIGRTGCRAPASRVLTQMRAHRRHRPETRATRLPLQPAAQAQAQARCDENLGGCAGRARKSATPARSRHRPTNAICRMQRAIPLPAARVDPAHGSCGRPCPPHPPPPAAGCSRAFRSAV